MDENSNDVNTEREASPHSEATAQESQTERQPQEQTEITGKENLHDVVSDVVKKHFPDGEGSKGKAQEESSVKEINQTKEPKADKGEQGKEDKDGEKKPQSAEQDKDKADDKTKVEGGDKPKPLTDEEITKLPKRAQERIRELVDERKQIETQYKEPATRMQNIEQFCQKNQISGVDFDNTFKLLALVRTNPTEGIKALESELTALKQATGLLLPQDLQKKVDEGIVDPETAKEMAKLRLEAQGRKSDADKFKQQTQQTTLQQLKEATNQWELSKKQTDPDFKPKAEGQPDGKYELVTYKFKDRFANGPQLFKIADVIALWDTCYKEVNDSISQFIPRRQIRQTVRSSNATSREEKQEPKVDISKPGWAKSVADSVLAKRGIER